MKIRHNIILMSLIFSLLAVIIFFNNFNLLTISNSYYANFSNYEADLEEEFVKFVFKLEDANKFEAELKNILLKLVDNAPANSNFTFSQLLDNELISSKDELSAVIKELEADYLNAELNFSQTRNSFKRYEMAGQIILITDKDIVGSDFPYYELEKMQQEGIRIHVIQLRKGQKAKRLELEAIINE